MKILIHHRTQGKGVEAVHVQGIAQGMRACGHEVRVVSPPGVQLSVHERKKGAVRTIAGNVPQPVFECLELAHNLAALALLTKAKNEFGCDLIYERYAFLGLASTLAARDWKVPLALEVNYTLASDLGVRTRSRLLRPLTGYCEKLAFRNASLLLPVSTALARDLAARGCPRERILVSPNAVDLSYFNPGGTGGREQGRGLFRSPPDVVVGFTGSFAPWHRVDLLMDACRTVAEAVRVNLGLMLVGEGGNRRDLEARAGGNPENLEVVFAGFVPHDLLPGYIASMDIAVMPHSNDYGSPMKIFEYMAMEKPVIAPDLVPLRDAVDHGCEGLLFTPGSREELVYSLLGLINDPFARREMGRRARFRVERDHNWKNRCERILGALAGSPFREGQVHREKPLSSRPGMTPMEDRRRSLSLKGHVRQPI
ncbi:MAG: glycosyltransferase family 4 protein [Pseudomonadota bacterium]|jgi:glycosyltransferase involved in cell wall biosynthesis|nr:glycosyltransferase family 4 protein [Pseudomonadota bacterium]HON62892.1 glycosyltransferase family 4 protein [Deltaproteobacteria bacterium]HRR21734.1 glycosyltransferase family 4 protein [Desulfomonilia bacterium]HRR70138.1 glycosyltransferase family 4 protein [Desulfomonilia bacterium]HRT45118.1 glycosyltransferase family 4 protein [Desulfomonilia bacterium]